MTQPAGWNYAILPFIEQQFPSLLRRYKERYGRAAYLRGAYPDMVKERVDRIKRRYGLHESEPRVEPEFWPKAAQMGLFEDAC